MAEEYFIGDISTWSVTNKGHNELQDIVRKLKHIKVKGTDLESFVKMVDTLVDDINYKYPRCKAMTFTCSKMIGATLLLHINSGSKDIASLRLYPILDTWKEVNHE